MIKKVELHLDALAAIVLLIVAAIAFIAYQRYQYLDLLGDNLDRQWKQIHLESEVARLEVLLKKATAKEQAAAPSAQKQ